MKLKKNNHKSINNYAMALVLAGAMTMVVTIGAVPVQAAAVYTNSTIDLALGVCDAAVEGVVDPDTYVDTPNCSEAYFTITYERMLPLPEQLPPIPGSKAMGGSNCCEAYTWYGDNWCSTQRSSGNHNYCWSEAKVPARQKMSGLTIYYCPHDPSNYCWATHGNDHGYIHREWRSSPFDSPTLKSGYGLFWWGDLKKCSGCTGWNNYGSGTPAAVSASLSSNQYPSEYRIDTASGGFGARINYKAA